jgi:hypothetical protein
LWGALCSFAESLGSGLSAKGFFNTPLLTHGTHTEHHNTHRAAAQPAAPPPPRSAAPGKLPALGNEDYHLLDPNTYDGDFFQEDGLEGSFEIDLTQAIEMEVDNEMGVDDNDAEEVQNDDDLRLLEQLRLGNDNDDDDTVPPLEHGVESMDMRDSDDDYDPNIPEYDDYF